MRELASLVVVRAALDSGLWRIGDEGGEGEGFVEGMMGGGIEVSTSAMLSMGEKTETESRDLRLLELWRIEFVCSSTYSKYDYDTVRLYRLISLPW